MTSRKAQSALREEMGDRRICDGVCLGAFFSFFSDDKKLFFLLATLLVRGL